MKHIPQYHLAEARHMVSPLPLAEYSKFFAARQDPDQSSADYVIQLRTLAASCSWPISLDRALAIVFVMGISSNKLRQQLLQKDYPSIDLALEQANQYDSILRKALRNSSSRPASSANLAASVNQVRGRSKSTSAAPPFDRCVRTGHSDDEHRDAALRPPAVRRLSNDDNAPLHHLLQDGKGEYTSFNWSSQCQQAFEVKKVVLSPFILTHYDPRLPIILSADASPVGVGAVIAHRLPDGRETSIAPTSKTLTPTEFRRPKERFDLYRPVFVWTSMSQNRCELRLAKSHHRAS
uniref:Reverse transcriptase/retrotransposon-derived protein RNase H-like domain-containing protein n=1 Tax=Plectus sambesii TaxID=2011161 RepID=A0A914WT78_9BILA